MFVASLIACVLLAAPESDPASLEVQRTTVTKALGFLDGRGSELERTATCINCHHAPLRFWALREASRAGLAVDVQLLGETATVQTKRLLELKDEYRGAQWGHSLSSFFVLGAADEEPLALSREMAGSLLKIILAEQAADGSWKAAQQFGNQRRPEKDANQAQTMWSMLALGRFAGEAEAQAAREKAQKWLAANESGTTIDVRALRLVVEGRWGSAERTGELLAALIKSQRADGGWGWQPDDASDAWGTGLALYAMSELGAKAPAKQIADARSFLATTQLADGSWLVEAKLTKKPEISSYFGTAWAIIGLSRTLPQP